jgi:hypothetical protein
VIGAGDESALDNNDQSFKRKERLVNRDVGSVVAAVILALLLVSPPVSSAAEQSANVHFIQHQLIFMVGILLGVGVLRLSGSSGGGRWVTAGLVLGAVVLQLVWNSPPVDSWADSSVTTHFSLHGIMFITGGLLGWGLASLFAGQPARGTDHSHVG